MQNHAINRVWRFNKVGGPEVLQLETMPIPEPGDDDILVKVDAFGLNRSDLLWMGAAFYKPELPARIGYEICGVIERVGSKVSGWKVGDRVSNFVSFFIGDYGAFANYALLPARSLMPTPNNMSAVHGAAYAMYFTAYMALRELADLRAYQTVLITAASSAAGITAISLSRKVGAKVIATTRTSAKRDVLFAAGAHHVIATAEEDLIKRVAEITNGVGADVIFDCVAGPQIVSLLQCIRMRGHMVCYGVLDTTPVTLPWYLGFSRLPRINFFSLLQFTGDRFSGNPVQEDAVARAKHFITEGVRDGSLPAHVAREFKGIEALPDAFRFMESNSGGGKVVVAL